MNKRLGKIRKNKNKRIRRAVKMYEMVVSKEEQELDSLLSCPNMSIFYPLFIIYYYLYNAHIIHQVK